MTTDSLSFNKEVSTKARSFLDKIISKAIDQKITYDQKEKIRGLGDHIYNKHYLDSSEIKIFLYKLSSYQYRKIAADTFKESWASKSHEFQDASKKSKSFLDQITKKSVGFYRKYKIKVAAYAVLIQRRFRGHLTRLIHKMEIMNNKLLLENENAMKRVRAKSIMTKLKK
jgi:hypothetical protein